MALYRTYRPAKLDEVVGQDHVTGTLRRALENDRIHHAYLFSGPRGCGKTSTARILARSLNCEKGPTPDPCGECQSCIDLSPTGAGSIDVIELDAASHGRVEDTRDLRERAMFAPVSSRYKIYIIDEAHMVTTQGFNALLKLVEEPPEHVRFIFATTEAEKVLPTIRSRTFNYSFRLIPARTLQEHLAAVCAAEGVPAEPAALALVARAGAGSARDSMSVLGQIIAGSGPEGVTYAATVQQLGMTDSALLDETVDALAAHDGAQMFAVVDKVMSAGHDPRRFVTDLLERLRNLIVLQHVPGAAETGLIDGPDDEVARQVAQAAAFGGSELARAADIVSIALTELKGATAPRLQLELMAARLLLPAADDDELGLRARLDALERRAASAPIHADATHAAAGSPAVAETPVASAPTAAPDEVTAPEPKAAASAPTKPAAKAAASSAMPKPPTPPKRAKKDATDSAPAATSTDTADAAAPVTDAAPAPVVDTATADTATADTAPAAPASKAVALGVTELRSLWPAVLEATKAYSRVAWMVFSDSAPLSLDDGTLAVGVTEASKVANIKASGHDDKLRQAVKDVARIDVRIDPVLEPNAASLVAGAPPAPAAAAAPDAAAAPAVADATPAAPAVDAPSMDDENIDDASGVDLIVRELGVTDVREFPNQ